jgi:hypothetical protein
MEEFVMMPVICGLILAGLILFFFLALTDEDDV